MYHRRGKICWANICGFSAIEVFTEILSWCLGHKCSLFSTIKERRLNSWKNFHGTRENRKSLAQRILNLSLFTVLQSFDMYSNNYICLIIIHVHFFVKIYHNRILTWTYYLGQILHRHFKYCQRDLLLFIVIPTSFLNFINIIF